MYTSDLKNLMAKILTSSCRFSKDLCAMTGKHLNSRWKVCWKFISPLIILSVIIGGIVQIIRQIGRGEFAYTAWDRDEVNKNSEAMWIIVAL